ncbi:hypothetical protein A3K86_08550 [Photobacterium jeanii]|uniref:Uncharacterized protein n=1 Tax=Photobacterium jeanii TaxID=858640 RepID=A0A178KIY7_9GAMM|nr:hypothetical protein [Photobacterium jeanii]OAN16975.1 hypothetical protein A3K86_08550 [Photobacterium jeanii]PST88265.1 hypothetical protein C9I91_16860 [Photobacterium jeanii]
MTVGTVGNSPTYSPATLKSQAAVSAQAEGRNHAVAGDPKGAVAETTVSISEEAKQKLAADAKQNAAEGKVPEGESKEPSKLESLTYGALGMDHPKDVEKQSDEYYTAGQVLSAVGTIGAVLLALA